MNFKDVKKTPVIAASLAIIAAAIACIHGILYSQYFDIVVILALLLGAAFWAVRSIMDNKVTVWFGLLGELCAAFGVGLFLTNSYNIWADTWGNISQNGVLIGTFNFFNSEGGPILPVIIIVLGLAACVCGIISCFQGKEAE